MKQCILPFFISFTMKVFDFHSMDGHADLQILFVHLVGRICGIAAF